MLDKRASVDSLFYVHDTLFLNEASEPKFMALTFSIVPTQMTTLTLGPHLFSV